MDIAHPAWKVAAQTKQRQLWSQVPAEWKLDGDVVAAIEHTNVVNVVPMHLSPAERRITELPFSRLLECLSNGEITAQEALSAFAHRAVISHQFVRAKKLPLMPSLFDRRHVVSVNST